MVFKGSEQIKPDLIEGQELTVKIEGLNHQGEGVGRIAGQTVFVPGSLPEETVRVRVTKIKKRWIHGQLIEVVQASPHRIVPACAHYASCGGCALQHLTYTEQLRWKQITVQEALRRIGRLPEVLVHPTLGMTEPWRYRNKVELHVGLQDKTVDLGYYQRGSHQLVSFRDCHLIPESWLGIIQEIRNGLQQFFKLKLENGNYDPVNGVKTREGFPVKQVWLRQSFFTGEMMVVWVITKANNPLWPAWIRKYARELNQRYPQITSIVERVNRRSENGLGEPYRVIYGKLKILEGIGNLRFFLSPTSFYQINSQQTAVLYRQVQEYAQLDGTEKLIDLYCGVGT
ncbi:MAG: 23S rRNA (uracil(1939)-C(5))-methyltransferase RlmD, partial [Syntrophomonadaceae bacterium]|nr:23S rRNA (uracil(1939)-C(5))-methyltransferase RlmD [Syntrophomonadaceae bacterium]